MLEASALRDRYQQFSATARGLLADFREVEENFRKLDRDLREKIATWHGAKGELLDDVLGSRETIADSDQGRSFQAFYDFLLSQARQDELNRLLESVHQLTEISEADPRLRTSTTTGWTPPSGPRPRCASYPSSSAAFSMIRCGRKTAG